MIHDEEQKAQELEQEIALMQREGHLGLQHAPPATARTSRRPILPPGFAPPEGVDVIEDGEVIGVLAEEQLQLRALRIKNRNLQK